MPEQPNWAIVLHALHEGQLATDISDGQSFTLYGLVEPLEEETGLEEDQIKDALNYLGEVGLVHHVGFDDEIQGALTPKGFEVAHERELANRQNRMNRLLTLLTAVLAFAAIIQAQTAYLQLDLSEQQIFGVLLLLFIVVILGLLRIHEIV